MGCIIIKQPSEISVMAVCMTLYCEIILNIISTLSTLQTKDNPYGPPMENVLKMMAYLTDLTAIRDYLVAISPVVNAERRNHIRKSFLKDTFMFISFINYINKDYPELYIKEKFCELHQKLDEVYKLHYSPLTKMYYHFNCQG